MTIEALRADIASHQARIGKLSVRGQTPDALAAVLRVELADNVYPLLAAIMDVIDGDILAPMADMAGAIDELIDQVDEVLHQPTAMAILAAFAAGDAMAAMLEAAPLDDVTRQRATVAVAEYRHLSATAASHVAGITLDPAAQDAREDADAAAPSGDVADGAASTASEQEGENG